MNPGKGSTNCVSVGEEKSEDCNISVWGHFVPGGFRFIPLRGGGIIRCFTENRNSAKMESETASSDQSAFHTRNQTLQQC